VEPTELNEEDVCDCITGGGVVVDEATELAAAAFLFCCGTGLCGWYVSELLESFGVVGEEVEVSAAPGLALTGVVFNLLLISGAPSLSACDVFSCARLSPTSYHKLLPVVSFCRNLPGGF
jgi:hypothetical protein